ncbi:hypothetical protein R1sor_000783 [Riccia sorocarpa]|uniref:Protein TIC 100 n=1 Tax=Riccia sorocarpa TaxID=122646 RepID=A0ABD3GVS7_9MARC
MAESDDEVPVLDGDNEEEDNFKKQQSPQSKNEIPNFRGRMPDSDKEQGKGALTVKWDEDEEEDNDDDDEDDLDDEDYDDTDEEDEEEPGAVGEEFAKQRREAARLRREKRLEEEEAEAESDDEDVIEEDELWNFPVDEYKWTEADIGEEWADPWPGDDKVGFDPDLVEDDEEVVKQWNEGRGPPQRPYYVPYRKSYPLIPEDHPDIQTPQDVVEELERYEEFLSWVSYIFEDGSTYEGTVWDDLAHGRGVYTTALELCKYEGEWFQNQMEGHGVMEVDIPEVEPHPDSEAAKKMRAQGKLLETDFMDPEDREWLKMEAEDTLETEENPVDPTPFEDSDFWVKRFGEKPEKGHYRYAGQWKHNRMHGCGLYEVNGRPLWGKFYFGEMLPFSGECDENQVAIHSSMAEIAAAKARMFINKPDGMVREYKGPYSDPSHPYMYEEEDLWMAPGFINEFYPVPENWRRYAQEVDEEREMWLNSFIKSPLRIPMPPELEYEWQKDDEFVLLSNKDSDPMYQDPANLHPDMEGEILLHTPTGQLINWAEDKDGNLRFFIQPITEDGEIRPELAVPLPLGFDEFMGEVDSEGKMIDESRRNLTIEERLKLEKEDKKKEKQELFQAELEEIKRKGDEEIKKLERDLYIRDLEDELDDLLLEERFIAEKEVLEEEPVLDEAPEEDEAATKVDVEGVTSEDAEIKGPDSLEDGERVQEGKKPADRDLSRDEKPAEEDEKPEDEEKPGEGKSDDEGSEDEDDDEDDKKPRSFGKVAMALPSNERSCHDQDKKGPAPTFPTVFGSITLMTQAAFKQVLESSVCSLKRAWSADRRAEHSFLPQQRTSPADESLSASSLVEAAKADNLSVRKSFNYPRLYHTSRAVVASKLPQPNKVPAAKGLLSSFHPKRRSRSIPVPCRSNKQQSASVQSTWTLPEIDVLSIAVPVPAY